MAVVVAGRRLHKAGMERYRKAVAALGLQRTEEGYCASIEGTPVVTCWVRYEVSKSPHILDVFTRYASPLQQNLGLELCAFRVGVRTLAGRMPRPTPWRGKGAQPLVPQPHNIGLFVRAANPAAARALLEQPRVLAPLHAARALGEDLLITDERVELLGPAYEASEHEIDRRLRAVAALARELRW